MFYFSMKRILALIYAIPAMAAAIVAIGCNFYRVEVSGRVVSYDFVKLESLKIRYAVRLLSGDLSQEGLASIRASGYFAIRIRPEKETPYYFSIEGFDNIPGASVTENSLEIADNRKRAINMGDVFIYNKITKRTNVIGPTTVEDIVVEWDSDIPSVDYYRLELNGRVGDTGYFSSAVSISRIKATKFAFSSLGPELGKEGTRQIGDLLLVVNNTKLEGAYFLDIIAVRQIDTRAEEVGRSNSEMVTIIRHQKI